MYQDKMTDKKRYLPVKGIIVDMTHEIGRGVLLSERGNSYSEKQIIKDTFSDNLKKAIRAKVGKRNR